MLALIRNAGRESAIFRSTADESLQWDSQTHMLASLLDVARWLQWAKTVDGSKNRNHPSPTPRPGDIDMDTVSGPRDGLSAGEKRFGNASMTLEEANAFLGWNADPLAS